ncbi:MAG: type II toxin-antitoxin system VapC family toxin [Myxococcales bacterium]|nr:type II toxin-antitoxin system VapC family toxin [Myxococcales bacterium]
MRLLLDTNVFLWLGTNDPRLSAAARTHVVAPDNEVWLSAASAWEIAIKHGLGKLPLPAPVDVFVPEARTAMGILELPIDEASALAVARLPAIHRDPFDRLLVAQAIVHGLTLVTADEVLQRYPTRWVW